MRSAEVMQTMSTEGREPTHSRRRIALAAFLVLSAFMYMSIIYKIINYGP
jgi:D-alanyl-lipoteichoic acid acyltransferase DltB (MBOAT superfamily)